MLVHSTFNEFEKGFEYEKMVNMWLDNKNLASKPIKNEDDIPEFNAKLSIDLRFIEKDFRTTIWEFSTALKILRKASEDYPDIKYIIESGWRIIRSLTKQRKYAVALKMHSFEYTIENKSLKQALLRDIKQLKDRLQYLRKNILRLYIEYAGLEDYSKYLQENGSSIDRDITEFHHSDEVKAIDIESFESEKEYFEHIDMLYVKHVDKILSENGLKQTGISETCIKYIEKAAKEAEEIRAKERAEKDVLAFTVARDTRNRVVSSLEYIIENGTEGNKYISSTRVADIINFSVNHNFEPAFCILVIKPYTGSSATVRFLKDIYSEDYTDPALSPALNISSIDYRLWGDESEGKLKEKATNIKVKHPDWIVEVVRLGINEGDYQKQLTDMKLSQPLDKNNFNHVAIAYMLRPYIDNIINDMDSILHGTEISDTSMMKVSDLKRLRTKAEYIPSVQLADDSYLRLGGSITENLVVAVIGRYHRILTRDEADLTDEEISNPTLQVPEETPDGSFAIMDIGFLPNTCMNMQLNGIGITVPVLDKAGISLKYNNNKPVKICGKINEIPITKRLSEAAMLYVDSEAIPCVASMVYEKPHISRRECLDDEQLFVTDDGLDLYLVRYVALNDDIVSGVRVSTTLSGDMKHYITTKITKMCENDYDRFFEKITANYVYMKSMAENADENRVYDHYNLLDLKYQKFCETLLKADEYINTNKIGNTGTVEFMIYQLVQVVVVHAPNVKFQRNSPRDSMSEYEFHMLNTYNSSSEFAGREVYVRKCGFYHGDTEAVATLKRTIRIYKESVTHFRGIEECSIFRISSSNKNRQAQYQIIEFPKGIDPNEVSELDIDPNKMTLMHIYVPITISLTKLNKVYDDNENLYALEQKNNLLINPVYDEHSAETYLDIINGDSIFKFPIYTMPYTKIIRLTLKSLANAIDTDTYHMDFDQNIFKLLVCYQMFALYDECDIIFTDDEINKLFNEMSVELMSDIASPQPLVVKLPTWIDCIDEYTGEFENMSALNIELSNSMKEYVTYHSYKVSKTLYKFVSAIRLHTKAIPDPDYGKYEEIIQHTPYEYIGIGNGINFGYDDNYMYIIISAKWVLKTFYTKIIGIDKYKNPSNSYINVKGVQLKSRSDYKWDVSIGRYSEDGYRDY